MTRLTICREQESPSHIKIDSEVSLIVIESIYLVEIDSEVNPTVMEVIPRSNDSKTRQCMKKSFTIRIYLVIVLDSQSEDQLI